MTFRTTSEIEDLRWMVEAEAIAHIAANAPCSPDEARRLLGRLKEDRPGIVVRFSSPWGLSPGIGHESMVWDPAMVSRAIIEHYWPAPVLVGSPKPGPRPQKLQAVRAKMLADYANESPILEGEKQETLASRYGCSRETAKKARVWALDQLQHNSGVTRTIDK